MLQPLGSRRVFVAQKGVGVDADRRHFQLAVEGPAIERLDVLQFVSELQLPVSSLSCASA